MTSKQQETIQNIVNQTTLQAQDALEKYLNGNRDAEFVIDMIESSSLKAIWQVIFEDVKDMDFQIDIDNAVRGH
ncbi:MAG: hypothetical protein U9N34_08080 [Candidatus Cloacimonadota bacterium]|nr:hypothetical protein [Candidatus Cloacimonadota bacterium]